MKNLDLFQEGETDVPVGEEKKMLSKYQRTKLFYNYRKATGSNKCGNCAEHVKKHGNTSTYHKCKIIGLSDSMATDIQVGAVCNAHRLGVE